MKWNFTYVCLLSVLFVSTSCNLLSSQNAPTPDSSVESPELTETAISEANQQFLLAETDAFPDTTPEKEQPPQTQEPQLPAAPIVEYIIPESVINPLLAGEQITISYIQMTDVANGWALGGSEFERDHILSTRDGGNTWQDVTPPEAVPSDTSGKSAISFFQDSETAWVAYYNLGGAAIPEQPVIWRTENGGLDWVPSAVLSGMNMASFYAPVALWFDVSGAGWFLVEIDAGMSKSYAYLFQSLDGGYLWEAIADPTSAPVEGSDGIQSCGKSEMVFAELLTGWMLRECPGLYPFTFVDKSVDGGSSWNMIELPPVPDPDVNTDGFCTPFDLNTFSADSLKVGLHCQVFSGEVPEDFYYLYSTSDGGLQWNTDTLPARGVSFLTEDVGWSLDREMYQTNDGGATWELFKTVIWDGQFSIIDANNWWAVARDGDNIELVYSSDGGLTWEILKPVIGK